MTYFRPIAVIALATAITSGLVGEEAGRSRPLYDRLGGKPAIQAVVDNFVSRILADTRVNQWFAHAAGNPEHAAAYKAKLADFICQATGGPCKYTGKDMIAAHQGRGVTSEAFTAVVEDLIAVLDEMKVPETEKKQLLGLLGPMKSAVVQQ